MPILGLFEIAVFIIVFVTLTISLFANEIKKISWKIRLVFVIFLTITITVHQVLLAKNPQYYFLIAIYSLEKGKEKLEPDDPAREEIQKAQRDIEIIVEYSERKNERYKRIAEEQKKKFGSCFADFEHARKFRKLGKNVEAIEILGRVITACPNFYLAHYNLGLAYEARGGLDMAELQYKKAAELEAKLSTRDPSIHNTYGFLLLRAHKFEEAEKEYRKAVEIDPEHPKARAGLEAARKRVML